MRHIVLACAVAIGAHTACTVQAHALTGKDPCEVRAKARKACWSMYT